MSELYTMEKLNLIANGDKTFIKMMIETFINSCKDGIAVIKNGLKNEDLDLVGRTGHKLKPSVDTIAPSLSNQVRAVESILESENSEEARSFVTNLEDVLSVLDQDLATGKFD